LIDDPLKAGIDRSKDRADICVCVIRRT